MGETMMNFVLKIKLFLGLYSCVLAVALGASVDPPLPPELLKLCFEFAFYGENVEKLLLHKVPFPESRHNPSWLDYVLPLKRGPTKTWIQRMTNIEPEPLLILDPYFACIRGYMPNGIFNGERGVLVHEPANAESLPEWAGWYR